MQERLNCNRVFKWHPILFETAEVGFILQFESWMLLRLESWMFLLLVCVKAGITQALNHAGPEIRHTTFPCNTIHANSWPPLNHQQLGLILISKQQTNGREVRSKQKNNPWLAKNASYPASSCCIGRESERVSGPAPDWGRQQCAIRNQRPQLKAQVGSWSDSRRYLTISTANA